MRDLVHPDGNDVAAPTAMDVRDHVRTPISQPPRGATPWRCRMPFAEPADASYHGAGSAPKAGKGVGFSKATGYRPGVVPEI